MTTEVAAPTVSPEQIIDLRRRVLAGEDVSNEELRSALSTLALSRVAASATATAKAKTAAPVIKIDLMSSFATFKQKSGSAPTSGGAPGETDAST